MAGIAHVSAWAVLVSAEDVLHLCGHILVALVVKVLESLNR